MNKPPCYWPAPRLAVPATPCRKTSTTAASRTGRSAAELAEGPHLVRHVQRGDLVGLGERWIVEHRVDQVVDGAAAAHHGLADVHHLGGAGTEDVHPEQRATLGRHQHLEHAVGVA